MPANGDLSPDGKKTYQNGAWVYDSATTPPASAADVAALQVSQVAQDVEIMEKADKTELHPAASVDPASHPGLTIDGDQKLKLELEDSVKLSSISADENETSDPTDLSHLYLRGKFEDQGGGDYQFLPAVLDEDDFASDSEKFAPTQQSAHRYIDRRDPYLSALGNIRRGMQLRFLPGNAKQVSIDGGTYLDWDPVNHQFDPHVIAAENPMTFGYLLSDGTTPTLAEVGTPSLASVVTNQEFEQNGVVTPITSNREVAHRLYIHPETGDKKLVLAQHEWNTAAELLQKIQTEEFIVPASLASYEYVGAILVSQNSDNYEDGNNSGILMASEFGAITGSGGSGSAESLPYKLVVDNAARDALTTELLAGMVVGVQSTPEGYSEHRILSPGADFAASVTEKIWPPDAQSGFPDLAVNPGAGIELNGHLTSDGSAWVKTVSGNKESINFRVLDPALTLIVRDGDNLTTYASGTFVELTGTAWRAERNGNEVTLFTLNSGGGLKEWSATESVPSGVFRTVGAEIYYSLQASTNVAPTVDDGSNWRNVSATTTDAYSIAGDSFADRSGNWATFTNNTGFNEVYALRMLDAGTFDFNGDGNPLTVEADDVIIYLYDRWSVYGSASVLADKAVNEGTVYNVEDYLTRDGEIWFKTTDGTKRSIQFQTATPAITFRARFDEKQIAFAPNAPVTLEGTAWRAKRDGNLITLFSFAESLNPDTRAVYASYAFSSDGLNGFGWTGRESINTTGNIVNGGASGITLKGGIYRVHYTAQKQTNAGGANIHYQIDGVTAVTDISTSANSGASMVDIVDATTADKTIRFYRAASFGQGNTNAQLVIERVRENVISTLHHAACQVVSFIFDTATNHDGNPPPTSSSGYNSAFHDVLLPAGSANVTVNIHEDVYAHENGTQCGGVFEVFDAANNVIASKDFGSFRVDPVQNSRFYLGGSIHFDVPAPATYKIRLKIPAGTGGGNRVCYGGSVDAAFTVATP